MCVLVPVLLSSILLTILLAKGGGFLSGNNLDEPDRHDTEDDSDISSFKPISRDSINAVEFEFECFYPLQKYSYGSYSLSQYASEDEENKVVSRDGVVGSWKGYSYSWEDSFDGTIRMERCSAGTLIVKPSDMVTIADSWGGKLAAEGGFVSYCKENELWLYDIEKEEHTLMFEGSVSSPRISPNGAFVVFHGEEDDCLMLYHDGTVSSLSEDLYPLSVSNCGTFIYARDEDGDVYSVVNMADVNYLESGIEDDGYDYKGVYLLNKDHTEIIFVADECIYFSQYGNDAQWLDFGNRVDLLLPNFCTASTNTYCVEHLYNQIIYSPYDYAMFYLDSNLNTDEIRYPGKWQMEPSGKYLCAMYSGSLVLYNIHDNMASGTVVQDDIKRFAVTSGGIVYYVTDSGSLWRISAEGNSTLIYENVSSVYATSHDEILFLADYDTSTRIGTLYTLDKRGQAKQIAENVSGCRMEGTDVYYETMKLGRVDVYISNGSTNFRRILKNVYSPYIGFLS